MEDGKVFEGQSFAGSGETTGELVFNTSMTGYQEILTDPSYAGQLVTLTYPLIGNYGVNREDVESLKIQPSALVIGECSRIPSNWRQQLSLPAYLNEQQVLGIHQVDTRAITLHIRSKGAMKCVISTEDLNPESLVRKAGAAEGLVGRDLSTGVSTAMRYTWPGPNKGKDLFATAEKNRHRAYDCFFDAAIEGRFPFRIAVLDCGVKINQLRLLARYGCELEVFPNNTDPKEILEWKPDGLFISNGPGDPDGVPQTVEVIQQLIRAKLPTFAICFGHQLLALALGGRTYKLKFGHRGGNQPVMDLTTGKVEITSQNHGFCVDSDSLDASQVEVTHINLNDKTCEGLRHKTQPLFSVQYHPEAAPGPHDSTYLFTRFMQMMEEFRHV